LANPLQPINRVGEPEDVAKLIAFLMDNDQSGFVTGSDYEINGGAVTNGGFKVIPGNIVSDIHAYTEN